MSMTAQQVWVAALAGSLSGLRAQETEDFRMDGPQRIARLAAKDADFALAEWKERHARQHFGENV